MGKGDRRSRRGKIFRGTHGKTRPKHGGKHHGFHPAVAVEQAPPKRRGRRGA